MLLLFWVAFGGWKGGDSHSGDVLVARMDKLAEIPGHYDEDGGIIAIKC